MSQSTEPLTLTVEQTARLLGVSRGVCYAAIRAGELPAIRLGQRRVVVPRARLMALLGEQNDNGPANGAVERTESPPTAKQDNDRDGE